MLYMQAVKKRGRIMLCVSLEQEFPSIGHLRKVSSIHTKWLNLLSEPRCVKTLVVLLTPEWEKLGQEGKAPAVLLRNYGQPVLNCKSDLPGCAWPGVKPSLPPDIFKVVACASSQVSGHHAHHGPDLHGGRASPETWQNQHTEQEYQISLSWCHTQASDQQSKCGSVLGHAMLASVEIKRR